MKYLMLISMCSIFSIFGCAPKEIYLYGTEEFETKAKLRDVSLEQAARLASNYYYKELRPDKLEQSFTLHIIYNNNYIFTTVFNNAKRLKYNLTGIWINGMTGEVEYVKTKKCVNVDLKQFPKTTYITTMKNENSNP
jgi:hypothetical protein